MKAITLARVSTEEQREAGNSLPAQVFRLQEYIAKHPKLEPDKEFIFDESAYKDSRQKFDDVIEYIEQQKETVALCCDKIDRLVRNFLVGLPKIARLLDEEKVELHFPSDNLTIHKNSPAADKVRFNLGVTLAQYYSDAISDNTKRALEQRLRDGRWIGPPRIGYIKVVNEDETSTHDADPAKAHLIRKAFELYATGNYSIKTLGDELYKLGLRSKQGGKLSNSMLHKILKDKFYIGIMTSRGKEYPHNYAKIVPTTLFNQVQEVLAGHQKKPVKYASKPFALRGLLTCKHCGCTITAERHKGKYNYYSCTNAKGICKRVYVNEDDLLKPIKDVMQKIQLPDEKVQQIVEDLKQFNDCKNEYHHNQLKKLQDEYTTAQRKLDNLMDLLLEDRITKEVYDKKFHELKNQQTEIEEVLHEHTEADRNYHITASTVFSLANRALEIFESSEPHEKSQLVSFLLQNCLLDGKKLEFTMRSPFDVLLETAHHPIGLRR